jgi:hypothetical protein
MRCWESNFHWGPHWEMHLEDHSEKRKAFHWELERDQETVRRLGRQMVHPRETQSAKPTVILTERHSGTSLGLVKDQQRGR